MTECKFDPKPGSNQREAPSTARDTPDGKVLIWFKGPDEPPPKEFHYSVSHRSKAGWRVYFLLVGVLAVPVCLLARLIVGLGSM